MLYQRGAIGHPDNAEVTFLHKTGDAKLKVSEIREFALSDPDSVRTDFIRLMPHASKAAAKALMSRRWLVLIADSQPFITSDNPVVMLRGSCKRPKYGLGTPGTIINFPVSPNRFLVLADEFERTFAQSTVQDREVFIRRIVSSADRFVFASAHEEMIASAIADRKQHDLRVPS